MTNAIGFEAIDPQSAGLADDPSSTPNLCGLPSLMRADGSLGAIVAIARAV